MKASIHLAFNGQCAAAFKFYEKCLGTKICFTMTYGQSPMAGQSSPDMRDKVIHTSMAVGESIITGADAPPDHYKKPQGNSVLLDVDTPAGAERVFAALGERGTVQMPIQETFWAKRFGMLVDQFGIPWMINCPKPM
jgi:PhnB protein